MPYQRVAANLHVVAGREVDQLIGLMEVEGLRIGTQYLPFQGVFRFQHIEIARERRCIGSLGKLRGTDGSADEDSGMLGGFAQGFGLGGCRKTETERG